MLQPLAASSCQGGRLLRIIQDNYALFWKTGRRSTLSTLPPTKVMQSERLSILTSMYRFSPRYPHGQLMKPL
jgi:hypothetical protein